MFRLTSLQVLDNTGAKQMRILQIYINQKKVQYGDVFFAILRRRKRLRKHITTKMHYVILTSLRFKLYRVAGAYYFRLFRRACVLVSKDLDKFLGTKVFTPIALEMRLKEVALLFKHNRIFL